MNAVGIDIAKDKSVVTIVRPGGEVVGKPFTVQHSNSGIQNLISRIQGLNGESKIVMECTGHYYEPLANQLSGAGLFVSAVNPKIINSFQDEVNLLRKVKTDNADSGKIARFCLDRWDLLIQYTSMDGKRHQLKTLNRQFRFYMDQKTAMKNNLISIVDLVFPGADKFFTSLAREDGHQKWVDFVEKFWHVDCVRELSLNEFVKRLKKWCGRNKYIFSQDKAEAIYSAAQELVPVLPKDDTTKLFIRQAVVQLNTTSATVEQLRALMNEIAATLPEYPVVMKMTGVGKTLGPQLIAEIGDITRFTKMSSLTAFAGVDPGVNSSSDYSQKSVRTSKRGSPALRKALYQVMDVLIKTMPQDDPVYKFMDKKRSEGKPYLIYMTAGANKFLRIYYGRVREYLASLES